uniref:hypothetical protein n=1 Tax=Aliarcobacter sp. TaxID=2321116 RepID=UPI0040473FAD
MIFLGLFLFIAFIVIALNVHNHSNLNKIEEYLIESKCENFIYSRGSYKALCDNYFIEVNNSFTVDIVQNSKKINYKDIKDLEKKDLEIIINNDYKMKFKEKKDLDLFYPQLEEKLN